MVSAQATIADSEFLDGLGAFVDRYVVPIETEHHELFAPNGPLYDKKGGYSDEVVGLIRQVRTASADAGYFTMLCPESLGGGGLGSVASFRAWEYLHHRYGPGRLLPYVTLAHWTSGPSYIMNHLSPRLTEELLPRFLSGEASMCFAMSEPDAGSDAWAMASRAVRDGDEWVINGTKQWISNSPHAGFALVFAVTNDELRQQHKGGISAFLVPTDTPGFNVDSVIKLFGHGGGNEAILSFTDVRVPADHLVGDLDRGFALAIGGVSLGRMYNAGRCVGLARWALEKATDYASQRRAFGQTIANYQGVSFMLADSAMEIYAARTMSLDCGRRLDAGENARKELAMVKAYATEMCFRVYDRAMQVHGGMGLTNELRLYDGWHQARIVRLADGSGEVMRRNIASALFHGDVAF
jgi:acyl-CoA dehydrogenase